MKDVRQKSSLSDEELVSAVRRLREQADVLDEAIAEYVGELTGRGWSWRRIAQALGVEHSGFYRWIQRRSKGDTPE